MKVLYDTFGDREDFGIASFTIDPEHDTPSALKQYSSAFVDKAETWNFLTGNKNDIYELANTGFNIFASINPEVAGGFEHQGYFALIDKMDLFVLDKTHMEILSYIIWELIKMMLKSKELINF